MYFCFDAETDGLYGEVFAIAAVVMDSEGMVCDAFSGKARANDVATPWVVDNVLLWIGDLPDYPDRKALREAFWSFWIKHRSACTCLADVPYPVEAHLMRLCVEGDLEQRQWQGPFPLIDVASTFAAAGLDPLTDRREFCSYNARVHHPLDDATASCRCYLLLQKRIVKNI